MKNISKIQNSLKVIDFLNIKTFECSITVCHLTLILCHKSWLFTLVTWIDFILSLDGAD